jgi:metal-responsive CopG/Arc/MetJ family transcriptional regulator
MSERVAVEEVVARFPAGTLAEIDCVLRDGEKRSEMIRAAVAAEIAARSAKRKPKP